MFFFKVKIKVSWDMFLEETEKNTSMLSRFYSLDLLNIYTKLFQILSISRKRTVVYVLYTIDKGIHKHSVLAV